MNPNVIFLLFLLLLSACKTTKVPAESIAEEGLSAISASPTTYEGKQVDLDGRYLGFTHAECNFPSNFLSLQLTRSDWVFKEGKWCCFVTGSLPSGLSPMEQKQVPVHLRATVRLKGEKIYLEFISATIQP
jgi:hypothetical protein